MDQTGVIRCVIELEEDAAWETRRLAERIHRLLNPELFPNEPPAPAVRPIDSLRPLAEYPVGRRRIGAHGPPNEPYPPPPGETSRMHAPAAIPPRMRSNRVAGRLVRPPPPFSLTFEDEAMNHSDGDDPSRGSTSFR